MPRARKANERAIENTCRCSWCQCRRGVGSGLAREGRGGGASAPERLALFARVGEGEALSPSGRQTLSAREELEGG